MLATRLASRPSVCPLASTTNHLRVISPALWKYVDIESPRLNNAACGTHPRASVTVTTFQGFRTGAGVPRGRLPGGQTQYSEDSKIPERPPACQRKRRKIGTLRSPLMSGR